MICPKGQGITSICVSHAEYQFCKDENDNLHDYIIKCCAVNLANVIDTTEFDDFFDDYNFNKYAKSSQYSVFGNETVTQIKQKTYGTDAVCDNGYVATGLHICRDYNRDNVSPLPGSCTENRDYGLIVGSILFVWLLKYFMRNSHNTDKNNIDPFYLY